MIVKDQTIGFSAEGYKAFFDSFNCPLITTSVSGTDFTLSVGNNLQFVRGNNGKANYSVNGTSVGLGGAGVNNQITVASSSNFFYMVFRSDVNTGQIYTLIELCEVISNRQYYSYLTANDRNVHSISELTLTDSVNLNGMYKHGKVLDYAADTNLIDYTADILFDLSDNLSGVTDLNCISCSTVTANQVLTFNLHNYYSIGANTLVPMDLVT